MKNSDLKSMIKGNNSSVQGTSTSGQNKPEASGSDTLYGSSYKHIGSFIEEPGDFGSDDLASGDMTDAGASKDIAIDAAPKSRPSSLEMPRISSNASLETGLVNDKWRITYKQFIACVLSEPDLMDFFEETHNLTEALHMAKNEGMQYSRSPSGIMDDSTA